MHQRYRRQTDRRQTTDGIATAISKRNVIRWRLLIKRQESWARSIRLCFQSGLLATGNRSANVMVVDHSRCRASTIDTGSRCDARQPPAVLRKQHQTSARTTITRWLYCVDWPQYSIRLEGYLCTSCLLPAFDDAYCHVPATEWCQRYQPCYLFTVSNPGLFFHFHVGQPDATAAYSVYSISAIERCQKFG